VGRRDRTSHAAEIVNRKCYALVRVVAHSRDFAATSSQPVSAINQWLRFGKCKRSVRAGDLLCFRCIASTIDGVLVLSCSPAISSMGPRDGLEKLTPFPMPRAAWKKIRPGVGTMYRS
jgi:hypothetical protein